MYLLACCSPSISLVFVVLCSGFGASRHLWRLGFTPSPSSIEQFRDNSSGGSNNSSNSKPKSSKGKSKPAAAAIEQKQKAKEQKDSDGDESMMNGTTGAEGSLPFFYNPFLQLFRSDRELRFVSACSPFRSDLFLLIRVFIISYLL